MSETSDRMATDFSKLLEPIKIRNVTIRNRMVSTAHNSRYGEKGMPTERYQLYTEEKARGGIGLIVIGGGGSVATDSKSSAYQLSIHDEAIIPYLTEFAKRVHRHGATLMCQLAHMGSKTRWGTAHWLPALSPSGTRERTTRSFPKIIEEEDIWRIIEAFAKSAAHCQEAGLAGIEVSAHAQSLVDEFLSPHSNHREDQWGGSLENRMRFAREVLKAIRKRCGDDFVIGMRLVGDEKLKDGLTIEECTIISKSFATEGLVDFLNVTSGQLSNHMHRALYSPGMFSKMAPFISVANAIKQHVKIPVMHAARIHDVHVAARAVNDGLIDMVGLTRAYIADPHLGKKIYEGHAIDVRPCVGANYCLDRLYLGGEALCIHNAATAREKSIPHILPKASKQKNVMVIGGGPGGLEAARACAERGHHVTLIEQSEKLGGKINIAVHAPWRSELLRIVKWREQQISKLGVKVQLSRYATADVITRENPDVVILATGGHADKGDFEGAELTMTVEQALVRNFDQGSRILVFDDQGAAQAASCAEYLASQGAEVKFVTPDRTFGEEMGPNNFPIFKRNLYKLNVQIVVDHRLNRVTRKDNRLLAEIANEYTDAAANEEFDYIVSDHGTRPDEGLYAALKTSSSNKGMVDFDALIACQPQPEHEDPGFSLYRIGDAVASRDIHAAIYDALRLCMAL